MTNDSTTHNTPDAAIEYYVDACRTGDIALLKDLFHPGSLMSGYFQGELTIGAPDIFFDEVRDSPLPEGADYTAEITAVTTHGGIASVELREWGYLGKYDLTNLFQLVQVNGDWRIVSKCYTDNSA